MPAAAAAAAKTTTLLPECLTTSEFDMHVQPVHRQVHGFRRSGELGSQHGVILWDDTETNALELH